MANPIFMSSAGALDVVNVVDFVKLLIAKHPNINEVLLDNAIEVEVLGEKPESNLFLHKIQYAYPNYDLIGSAAFSDNDPSRDWSIGDDQIDYFFEEVKDNLEDILIRKFLTDCIDVYRHDDLTDATNAFERAAVEALENFVTPTHIITLKPKTFMVADINDWTIQVENFDGIVKAVIYPTRKIARYATEAPNVLDF